jgi:hypothetical protein
MRILSTSLFCLSCFTYFCSSGSERVPIPTRINACMESPKLKSYKIDQRTNPYYLRGDFDGDEKPDFAVMVTSGNNKTSGLIICQGDGRSVVLGAGSRPGFSTMPEDNFLSSDWEVVTLAEFRELLYDKKVAALAKGEVICLTWEDGNAYIYWDGERYRWFLEPAGGQYK